MYTYNPNVLKTTKGNFIVARGFAHDDNRFERGNIIDGNGNSSKYVCSHTEEIDLASYIDINVPDKFYIATMDVYDGLVGKITVITNNEYISYGSSILLFSRCLLYFDSISSEMLRSDETTRLDFYPKHLG